MNKQEKREKVIKGLELCSREKGQTIGCLLDCPYDGEDECHKKMMRDAIALLKAQNEVIEELLKVGYPHNFQREEPWIVNYMYAITDVIKKAVNLNNESAV